MTKLKVGMVGAIVVAGVTAPLLIQHQAQARLQAKEEALREQTRQILALSSENEHLSNLLAQAKAAQAPADELLRLRGEIGVLRRQNAELAAKQHSKASAGSGGPASQGAAESAGEPFRSQVHAEIGFGQTLVTGGWATSPGHRMLVFVKPELQPAAGAAAQSIILRPTLVEIPEQLMAQYDLGSLRSDANQTVQQGQLFASDEAKALLEKLGSGPEARLYRMGGADTLPGVVTELQVAGDKGGGATSLKATADLTPDGKGVDLQFETVIAPATGQ